MTTKDISRFLHQPKKHYVGARMQQGRVLLDSDFNEGTRLNETDQKQVVLDIVGPQASPDAGFSLGRFFAFSDLNLPQTPPLRLGDPVQTTTVTLNGEEVVVHAVTLRTGAMYLGGMRFSEDHPEHIAFQGDFLQMKPSDIPTLTLIPAPTSPDSPSPASPDSPGSPSSPDDSLVAEPFRHLYYLHAWEQTVSAIEDEELRERALGGPDTSVRVKRMRRAQILGSLPNSVTDCATGWQHALTTLVDPNSEFDPNTSELRSKGRLFIDFEGTESSDTCAPCDDGASGRYLGAENQTVRVMLSSPTTFVWAFDNSAPLYRVRVTGLAASSPVKVEVEFLTQPPDEEHWPLENAVIEILPFAALLEGEAVPSSDNPHFRKVAAEIGVFSRASTPFDPTTRKLGLDLAVGIADMQELVHTWDDQHPHAVELNREQVGVDERFFYARVWHQAPTADDVHLETAAGDPLGDTGVKPVFVAAGRRGDFWSVSLRPSTPDQVVPLDLRDPAGAPPHGPHHFYAPLALVDSDGVQIADLRDCRAPLRRGSDESCVTLTVGDGATSLGDFQQIQEAINALPPDGGRILIRRGLYRQRFALNGLRSVVIEGCGDGTVLQSPPGVELTNPICRLRACEAVAIRGLTLVAVDHAAISVEDSQDVNVTNVTLIAGVDTPDGVIAGDRGVSNAPLLNVAQSDLVTAEKLIFEPVRRPAVDLFECQISVVRDVTAVGSAVGIASGRPMISLDTCSHATVRDVILQTYGQVGISVEGDINKDIDLYGLTVIAAGHEVARTHSAVDIGGGERIQLTRSRFTMDWTRSDDAVVVVKGRDVVVSDNDIETTRRCFDDSPPSELAADTDCLDTRCDAWGGLQVRGGSQRVIVRGNHVLGGLGHGITLGSVLWYNQDDSPETAARREGAGQALIKTEGGALVVKGMLRDGFNASSIHYLPIDEGPLREISVVDNHVEGMLTNGISVPAVLGLVGDDLFELERSKISGNTVVRNLARPAKSPTTIADVLSPPMPNVAADLTLQSIPYGGIVLSAVTDGVDIRANTIRDNGARADTVPVNGVFILNGDAINISDNRIANNGAVPGVAALLPGVRAGIAVMLAGTGTAGDIATLRDILGDSGDSGLDNDGSSLRISGNSIRQPEGRALHAVATGPVKITNNYFSSLGFHGSATDAGDLYAVGDVVYVQNLGRPWEAFEVDDLPEDVVAPFKAVSYLTRQNDDISPLWFSGDGGHLLFSDNQVTYDWFVRREAPSSIELSVSSVALVSLDHVAVLNNQFALRVRNLPNSPESKRWLDSIDGPPLLANVFALGGTVQAANNRVAENHAAVDISLFTFAQMLNTVSLNQTTHPNVVFSAASGYALQDLNQVLFNDGVLSTHAAEIGTAAARFLALIKR